jgi:hypothetical protein
MGKDNNSQSHLMPDLLKLLLEEIAELKRRLEILERK